MLCTLAPRSSDLRLEATEKLDEISGPREGDDVDVDLLRCNAAYEVNFNSEYAGYMFL